jgi:antitoxin ParD1/3/4
MTAYVEARIAEGRYGNVSEYFRDLVRRDQERRAAAIAELRALLARAEASGVSERSMSELIEAARDEARSSGLLGDD